MISEDVDADEEKGEKGEMTRADSFPSKAKGGKEIVNRSWPFFADLSIISFLNKTKN